MDRPREQLSIAAESKPPIALSTTATADQPPHEAFCWLGRYHLSGDRSANQSWADWRTGLAVTGSEKRRPDIRNQVRSTRRSAKPVFLQLYLRPDNLAL